MTNMDNIKAVMDQLKTDMASMKIPQAITFIDHTDLLLAQKDELKVWAENNLKNN